MSPILAYLVLDGSGIPQDQLKLCVFMPSAAIALAWLLIKWKSFLVIPALIISMLSALIVIGDAFRPFIREAMIEDFGYSYVAAIFLSAAAPFVAIAVFYFEARSRAIQPSETTRGK